MKKSTTQTPARPGDFIFDSGNPSQEWLSGYHEGVKNATWHYRNGIVEAIKRAALFLLILLIVFVAQDTFGK